MVQLDILSDPICPWCYIGKAHLDKAMAEIPDHPFTIQWHPFQLNPEMPPEGMDRRDYLEHKFGGKEGALKAYAPIVEAAEKSGLEIDFGAIQRTPNTLNAHRLIHWAGIESKQTAMVSSLFKAYFVEGRDIGDGDVLADLADAIELDASLVQRLLSTDEDIDDIKARDAKGRDMGVTGVPCFIINGQHAVPGAQPPEMWINVIKDIKTQLEKTG